MTAIPIVGRCFDTAADFLAYLEGVKFNLWHPKFVTMHHTGSPTLAKWKEWQVRADPVTDDEWLRNLAAYYGNEMKWSSGPHFFITPKHICVLSPPNARGVHAVSFNALAWGVEVVGDFDSERLDGDYRKFVMSAFAAMHVAAGLSPGGYVRGERGLHFHRDDPKTTKTCPGKSIVKGQVVAEIEAAIAVMTFGEHPSDVVKPVKTTPASKAGVVNTADLNLRLDASGKAPVVAALAKNVKVAITGQAINTGTTWLAVTVESGAAKGKTGWVAARYVTVA